VSNKRVRWATTILTYFATAKMRRFTHALQHPEIAQQKILQKIIRNLKKSAYGKTYPLPDDAAYTAYQSYVPIVTYEALIPWIEKQKKGLPTILTTKPVVFFEITSGSSGSAKYIPYTKTLLRAFNHLFSLWAYDIIAHGPSLTSGKIFMSISPPLTHKKTTAGNIPIGLHNDSHYLRILWRSLMKPFLVSPPKYEAKSIETYRYLLAATLVAEENLEIISIWNPTYLLIILDTITTHREELCRDLSRGYIIDGNAKIIFPKLSPQRKALLAQDTISWPQLWPTLKFISCWTEGSARTASKKLARLFPTVFIQGKGLLATEAPITLPLMHASGCVPMLSDVFFEFLDATNNVFLLHELNLGESYEIIISQQGGLYRYRLGDRVKVVGKHYNTPCFEFLGRVGNTCDLVGEKLHEQFVRATLSTYIEDQTIFFMLLPHIDENGLGSYVLLSEPCDTLQSDSLDTALFESYHYHNARVLGQLAEPKIIIIENLAQHVQEFFIAKDMRWGNIKDRILISDIALAKELIAYIANLNHCHSAALSNEMTIKH
jgi:hypothetical protein